MSGMNDFLASYYGTAAAAETAPEDLQKQAEIELFGKLAASQNIDLNTLPDEQVEQLFADFQKQASEEKKDDKEDEAKKELEEKKAASEKVAEADSLGRIMAHAYVDELRKIAAAEQEKEAAGAVEVGMRARHAISSGASAVKGKAKELAGKAKDVMSAKEWRQGSQAKSNINSDLGTRMFQNQAMKSAPKGVREDAVKAMRESANRTAGKHISSGRAKTLGAYGAAAGVAGAGTAAAMHKKKESSAVDELAAELAVVKAAEAGYDLDDAAEKIAALLLEGPAESEKTAGVFDLGPAVEIRSLELLEQLGVPVDWNI